MTGAALALLCNFLFHTAGAAGEPKRLLILGDSLTAGYGIEKTQAYPALLQQTIDDAGLDWTVSNGGRSGDTTRDGLNRLRWLLKKPADLLVIALGGNDGLRGLAPESTAENLGGIVDRAREANPQILIVLAGMEMPDNMGETYTKEFKALFPAVAKDKRVHFLPLLLKDVAGVDSLNQDDLIHPNEAGHRRMAQTMWVMLEPLLRGGGDSGSK